MKNYLTNIDIRPAWIQEVPDHWKVKRLKYLVAIPLKYGANESGTIDSKETIRYLRITDFDDDGNLRDGDNKYLDPKTASDYMLEDGDVLFARSGATVGKTFHFKNSEIRSCFAGYLIQAKPNKKILNSDFLSYFTKSEQYSNWKNSIFIQATIQNIGADKYNNLLVPTPPLPEQEAIASFLDRKTKMIDDLIAKKERLIELKKEERTAIINQAVTKGLDPNVPMKDSGIEWLGEIPEHWGVNRIKFLCDIQGRIGYKGYKSLDLVGKGEGAITLGGGNLSPNNTLDFTRTTYLDWDKYFESPEIMVCQGNIIVAQRGTLGRVGYVDKDYGPMTINPSLVLLKNIVEDAEYLTYYFSSNYITNTIDTISNATAVPMLSQEQIGNFYCLIPPKKEQGNIVNRIKQLINEEDKSIELVKRQIEFLQEYKTTLISEAVTGKISVNN